MILNLLAFWYQSKLRWTRLKRAFSVPGHFVTLDIGSGDSPFAPANVLCEKFIWDDSERTARLQQDRPLVVGDIEALPFRDKSFDFIYCCHVLEHTYHPDIAIRELMRVGRSGYIEMPSAYMERVAESRAGHLWFVRSQNGRLSFTPKPRGILDPELNDMHMRILLNKDPLYSAFHYARFYSLFNIGLEWQGTIPYRIEEVNGTTTLSNEGFEKASLDESHVVIREAVPRSTLAGLMKRWIHWRAARAKKLDLQALIACPICKGVLVKKAVTFVCQKCALAYPIQGQIPVLLKESSTSTTALLR